MPREIWSMFHLGILISENPKNVLGLNVEVKLT